MIQLTSEKQAQIGDIVYQGADERYYLLKPLTLDELRHTISQSDMFMRVRGWYHERVYGDVLTRAEVERYIAERSKQQADANMSPWDRLRTSAMLEHMRSHRRSWE